MISVNLQMPLLWCLWMIHMLSAGISIGIPGKIWFAVHMTLCWPKCLVKFSWTLFKTISVRWQKMENLLFSNVKTRVFYSSTPIENICNKKNFQSFNLCSNKMEYVGKSESNRTHYHYAFSWCCDIIRVHERERITRSHIHCIFITSK